MRGEVVGEIARARGDLLEVLAGIDERGYVRDTVCDGWTVKHVLAHLVAGELALGALYRDEIREQGFLDPEIGIAPWIPLPGAAVAAALWQHGSATQRALDALTDERWHAPIRAYGCRRIAHLVRLHLFDLTVHGHDITTALDVPSSWGPSIPFLVEFVVRAAPPTLARHGVEPRGRLRIEVPSMGGGWILAGSGGRWSVAAGEGEAQAAVKLDAEDLVLVTTGRRARADASIDISGDVGFAEELLQRWRVV